VSVILHRCKKAATHLELILASEHNRHCSWNRLFTALAAMLLYLLVACRVLRYPY
jgi:hypothetical protein